MNDLELIEKIKEKTFSRIRDLMSSRYKEAAAQQLEAEIAPGWDTTNPPEPAELPPELFWRLLNAPLTDLAVHLLQTIFVAKIDDTFVASKKNVDKMVATIDQKEVVRVTGFKPEDAAFVLDKMAESLVEVVREYSVIYIEVDRQRLRLCMLSIV